jgi:hypothetical protein
VRTDERRLRQVLQNLLDNAVKYTDAGRVGLSARLRSRGIGAADGDADRRRLLLFTVTDTGRGIAEADRERLFAPFEQDHHGQEGSGLGLAICRELAAVLGGELTAATAHADAAAAFASPARAVVPTRRRRRHRRSPRSARPSARLRRPAPTHPGHRRQRGTFGGADGRPAATLGFAVDTADSAEAALARPAREPPDLVITDLRMPGSCGYAATWQLRTASSAPTCRPSPPPPRRCRSRTTPPPSASTPSCSSPSSWTRLQWQRGDAGSLQATPAPGSRPSPTRPPTGQPAEPPPRMELEAALELAELNHWDSLRDWCTALDDAFPECGGFAQRVHALLDQIDAGTQTDAPVAALRRLLADRG